ncbi:Diaminopimelate epimerase 1 [uncultured spirochete]|jgi:diaminopimelate epimerase|uniref:Diaminopimelate epimerase n=1 Tax=uncultured spirochete TaxID=156406 RepID=A0A3P3XMM4_9SPIR|nr:Diaminopimelate epimerase 1 [uncultured spirochete]
MAIRCIPEGFHAHKYHALGNDYLVIDPEELQIFLSQDAISALCDRNRGIGSDGILYGPLAFFEEGARALPDDSPFTGSRNTFALRIFNPDGSEAEKSGNGLRIFSLYLYESGRVDETPFQVRTKGGLVECQILPGEGEERFITVAMGEPQFLPGSTTLSLEGVEYRAVRVSMGNPHCVLMGPPPSPELAKRIGPLVEHHQDFPNRTNVQFLEVLDRKNIRIEIWERGAGYTLASGSSSCAAAAAAKRLGLVDDTLTVHMPGGALEIDMQKENIKMTGPAVRAFDALFSPYTLSLAQKR